MVSMVGAGLLTVDQAIYMVMGNVELNSKFFYESAIFQVQTSVRL